MSDWRLLRQYIEHKSEAAFSSLIERHIKMVYWTCWRELGNQQQAEDAVQEIFLILVKRARDIHLDISISGWLFNTARLVCRNIQRSEVRRSHYENEMSKNMESAMNQSSEWKQIEPALNDALTSLSSADREMVLMRYFEGFSVREIGLYKGISENAAGKRILRAIDKLRYRFKGAGATLSSSSLISMLKENSSPNVPDSFKESVLLHAHKAFALHSTHLAGHSLPILLKKGAYILMELSIRKIAVILLGSLLLVGGTTLTVAVAQVRQHDIPPDGTAAGLSWEEGRLSSRGDYLTIVESGPFWMAGSDKTRNVTWMVRGVGIVSVVDPKGTLLGESNSRMVSWTPARRCFAMLFGIDPVISEKSIQNPQVAIDVNGVTTYETGYGAYTVKNSFGKVIETLTISHNT